jgi:hypothetical protein
VYMHIEIHFLSLYINEYVYTFICAVCAYISHRLAVWFFGSGPDSFFAAMSQYNTSTSSINTFACCAPSLNLVDQNHIIHQLQNQRSGESLTWRCSRPNEGSCWSWSFSIGSTGESVQIQSIGSCDPIQGCRHVDSLGTSSGSVQ